MNYVSCSPFRVPIARLAAARAALFNAPKAGTSKTAKPKAKAPAKAKAKAAAKKAKKPARKR